MRSSTRAAVVPWPLAVIGLCVALVVGFAGGRLTDGAGVGAPTASNQLPGATAAATDPTASDGAGSAVPSPSAASLSRRYGVASHLLWGDDASAIQALDQLAAAGLGVVRFDVSWRHMQPAPGQVDGLDRLDRLMAAITARGMRPIIVVIETPDWANGGRGGFVPPDDPGTYASFVASLAGRYASEADVTWEVWNEPNDPRFWQPAPDPAAYTRLLIRTSTAVRAAAPTATLLGGSILYGDSTFLAGMYAAGAKGSFDGLAVHPYAQNRSPGDVGDPYHSFAGGLDRLRGVMEANGDGKTPMWITEMGWSSTDVPDEATRASYLAQATAMVAQRPEIEVFAAYVFGPAAEPEFELEASGPGSTAFNAYRDAARSAAAQAP